MSKNGEKMITYKLYTNVGNREKNEDSIGMYISKDCACFFLADGLGGHGGGEYASQIAVETAKGVYEKGMMEDSLTEIFERAQYEILSQQMMNMELADMKTTLVALEIGNDAAKWGHIGDSRLYYFQRNKLETRTLDHSVPQALAASGKIREKDIRGHEDRNRLLRVLGSPWNKNKYEIAHPVKREPHQAFLLCSDGFWELIDEKTMKSALKKSDTVEEWLEYMAAEVNKNGRDKNMDNNSAIAVWID